MNLGRTLGTAGEAMQVGKRDHSQEAALGGLREPSASAPPLTTRHDAALPEREPRPRAEESHNEDVDRHQPESPRSHPAPRAPLSRRP